MYCKNCGKKIEDGATFCRFCGVSITQEPPQQKKPKTAVIVIIAAIVVGLSLATIFCYINLGKTKSEPDTQETKDEVTEESKEEETEEEKDSDEEDEAEESQIIEEEEAHEEPIREDEEEASKSDKKVGAAKEPEVPKSVSNSDIDDVSESSYLTEDDRIYKASNAFDGDPATAWSEGISGTGEGEYIYVSLDSEYSISGFKIKNGYHKSQSLYTKNSRPKMLEVIFSDGSSEVIELDDSMTTQKITFSEPYVSDSMEFRIKAVYSGTDYDDTLISEIELF